MRNYVVRCNHVQFLCRIYSVAWIDSNHVQFSECHDLFSYLDRQYAETNILSLVPFFKDGNRLVRCDIHFFRMP
jgi:hypothetical protein